MQTLLLAWSYGMFAGLGYLLGEVFTPHLGGETTVNLGTVGAVAGVVVPGALAVIITYFRLKIEVIKLQDTMNGLYCIKNKECMEKEMNNE